ncbi:MAG: type II/IV secretion system protein [Kiritimatiellae bacterium]|nr:type II/IV secretion system protein [Kiritimatiellia bacterium]
MGLFEDRLVADGLVSGVALEQAKVTARLKRRSLTDVLIDTGLVKEGELLKFSAKQYGLSFVDIEDLDIDPNAIRAVSAKLATHYDIVPVKLSNKILTIAVSNPMDMAVVEDIEVNHGFHVERVLVCRSDISKALRKYYGVGVATVERILADGTDREDVGSGDVSHDLAEGTEDASVVRLVNQLLKDAIKDRATDIHFEIMRDHVVTRRRIDGVLHDTRISDNIRVLYPSIVSRIKLMSGLNIVERRLPQDGRARVNVDGLDYDLRVSVVPSIHGEDVVIRILPTSMLFDLKDLGYSGNEYDMLVDLISKPHGIIFVTGPTGSGKSTTLYACLSRLNTRERKIITIEDPVEYELPGITQTQINPKIGLTFERSLRSMLRHDPDVMMVGEVRDAETAEIAVQTAMTGHLVLSTLHTNDAASAAVRLIDMGVEPYLITTTVLCFVAQRLIRVICENCKESYDDNGEVFYRGAGCRKCGGSGYSGRVSISEILPLAPSIQELIIQKRSAADIRLEADKLGFRTLRQDGEEKVRAGITTQEELLRVTAW